MSPRLRAKTQDQQTLMAAWQAIPWKKVHRHVFRLQKRIYQATRCGDVRTVYCGLFFQHADQLEIDHINGKRQDSRYANLQALHGHCHDAKTRDQAEHLPVGMRDKYQNTEERRDRKRSCSVLKQR
jgi:5-methylcytosine-specific restriction endonuclease McrA